jgi:hypothetical protein
MDKSAIRLWVLAICATALAVVPTVAPVEARTSQSQHIKKHKKIGNHDFYGFRHADRAWPGGSPPYQSGEVCPGIARSFECKIWPPPINEDPDRKMSGTDGS